jgi:D-alanyl-D-alanine dipeptidase
VPEIALTVAAAQMACSGDVEDNLARMRRLAGEAAAEGADVVAFPELAVTGPLRERIEAFSASQRAAALTKVKALARDLGIAVAFGMPHRGTRGALYNAAFVVGPDGALLTRYDQLVVDRADLFAPGASSKAMWFEVRGVPAVVTVGGDALWSEIAELAAVRGASLHLHLAHDLDDSGRGRLLRKQLWVNLASYRTLTVTVNAASPASGGSAIWQDFYRGSAGRAGGYLPHAAVPLVEASRGEQLICATQGMLPHNSQYERMTQRSNRQMGPWYAAGAQAIYDSL